MGSTRGQPVRQELTFCGTFVVKAKLREAKVQLLYPTSYHPQTDGQSERMNMSQ